MPDPFDVGAFIGMLALERGRAIELIPVAARPHLPCGLVVTTDDADLIVYSADTSTLHRRHILLHEAAHLVCGHSDRPRGQDGPSAAVAAAAGGLLPHLPAELVHRVLGRTVYSEPQEREAELVASLILYRVARHGRPDERAPGPPTRFEAIFGLPES